MFENSLKLKKILLFGGDAVLLYFTLWLTLTIRYGSAHTFDDHVIPFSIVYGILALILYIDGLYDFDFTKNKTVILNKLALSIGIGTILAATFFYFTVNRFFTIRPQRVLLINILIAFIFLFVWRLFFYFFVQSPKFSNNLLVVANNSLAQEIIKKISSNPHFGFTLKAVYVPPDKPFAVPEGIHVFSDMKQYSDVCSKFHIRTITFSETDKSSRELLLNLFACLPFNVIFYELSTFYEKIMGKIPVDYIQHIWFLENLNEGAKRIYEMSKQLFDIVASLVVLVILLPVIPFIIVAVKLDSLGPVLFTQYRVGKHGKKFLAMKFRSMHTDAEKTGPQWAQKNDPRVTRVGTFLRRTRLDEVPQLVNILKGEMSLIGPRPERPEFVEQLKQSIPFYEERLLVKPGLTGWAQVMGPSYGGSVQETLDKIQYDLYYIKNRSVGLDISIALKTIKTMLNRSGQ